MKWLESSMGELLKFITLLFSTPGNYAELLKKLAVVLFCETLVAIWLLRQIPAVDSQIDRLTKLISLDIPFGYVDLIINLLLAFLIAIVSFAAQLHDRISDWFRIRSRFDRNNILLPLALLVGVRMTGAQLNAVVSHRDSLMRNAFYRYASSRSSTSLVDKHDIEHALGAWSWYWVLIEGMVLSLICAVTAACLGAVELACVFGAWLVVYWFLSILQYSRLERYVRPEIETIAQDEQAVAEVQRVFSAL